MRDVATTQASWPERQLSAWLCSEVRRFTALFPDHKLAVRLLRDGNPLIDAADVEALAKLPDYQGDD